MFSFKDGTGVIVPCRQQIDELLGNMSEFDKTASAAAATIIALIPLICSNSDLPTADVFELYMMGEYVLAFFSAGLTFGLPASQQRSRQPIKATYLSSRQDILNALSQPPCFYWRYVLVFRFCFIIVQVALLFGFIALNTQPILGNIHPIWLCPRTAIVSFHAAVFGIPPLVGSVWLLALFFACRWESGERTREHRRIELYPGKNIVGKHFKHVVQRLGLWFARKIAYRIEYRIVLYPSRPDDRNRPRFVFARFLLGLGNIIMVIFLTAAFGSVYGATFPTAIGRMLVTAGYLLVSRLICIIHSRYVCAGTIFVTYDGEAEKEEVMRKWRTMDPSVPCPL